ncbi:hypothetical protein [Ectobacillus funiculus]|uniref:hypothetical protein n=1 Tax=Ectobacillus funiculus TaxID=137993 RepID=UPI00101D48EF|nr:hypothetical protein [Ectobacillus funiculus]
MLLNKISKVRKTVGEYKQLDQKLLEVKRVNSFFQFTKDELNKCKTILRSYSALHAMDEDAFPKRNMSFVIRQLEALSKDSLENYNRDEVLAFSRPLKKLDADLKIGWMHYVRNKNNDIIGLLDQMQSIVNNPNEIKQLIVDLKQFESKWPVTSTTVNRYHDQLANAKKVISDMQASKGIQEFIGKVATNHATLDDLTEEVILWLRKQQLMNKLVIKFK